MPLSAGPCQEEAPQPDAPTVRDAAPCCCQADAAAACRTEAPPEPKRPALEKAPEGCVSALGEGGPKSPPASGPAAARASRPAAPAGARSRPAHPVCPVSRCPEHGRPVGAGRPPSRPTTALGGAGGKGSPGFADSGLGAAACLGCRTALGAPASSLLRDRRRRGDGTSAALTAGAEERDPPAPAPARAGGTRPPPGPSPGLAASGLGWATGGGHGHGCFPTWTGATWTCLPTRC